MDNGMFNFFANTNIYAIESEYKVKNILQALEDNEIDIVLHGCNCFHNFGKGIAIEIKNRFPDVYEKDKETKYGDKDKLGTISYDDVGNNRFIVNCYTQYHWREALNNEKSFIKNGEKKYVLADYRAIRKSLIAFRKKFAPSWKIGMPKIGERSNGSWKRIEAIIREELIDKGYDVTFYVKSEKEIPK